jgi:hypothetical protein
LCDGHGQSSLELLRECSGGDVVVVNVARGEHLMWLRVAVVANV